MTDRLRDPHARPEPDPTHARPARRDAPDLHGDAAPTRRRVRHANRLARGLGARFLANATGAEERDDDAAAFDPLTGEDLRGLRVVSADDLAEDDASLDALDALLARPRR